MLNIDDYSINDYRQLRMSLRLNKGMSFFKIYIKTVSSSFTPNRVVCSAEKAGLTGSAGSEEKEHRHQPRSLEGPCAEQRCSSAAMHRLRTTYARLRPLTAAPHTAKTLSQPRLFSVESGLRTLQPARHLNSSVTAEPFLNGTSSNYLEEMYYAWLEDPKNVHKVLYTTWKLSKKKKTASILLHTTLPCPSPRPSEMFVPLCSDCILHTEKRSLTPNACICICKEGQR